MNISGISIHFVLSTIAGIGIGILMIHFRREIAEIVSTYLSTTIIRDLDKPYAYVFLGVGLILWNSIMFIMALL